MRENLATCHVRVYDENGLVMSTNPAMDAIEMAHLIVDIISNPDDHRSFAVGCEND